MKHYIITIKETLKNILSQAADIIRQVFKTPGIKRYAFLSFILFIFFMFLTFPYDVIVMSYIKKIEGQYVKNVQLSGLNISLLSGIKLQNASLTISEGTDISLKNFIFDTSIMSYITNNLKSKISSDLIEYSSAGQSYSGKLSAETDLSFLDKATFPSKGFLTVKITNAVLKGLTIQGFNIPPMKINTIDAKINFSSGEMVIQGIDFKGTDLSGNIKGTVYVDSKIFNRSRLMVKLTIDSNSTVLDNYRMLLSSMIDPNTNSLTINLKGTIANPTPDIPGMGQNPTF